MENAKDGGEDKEHPDVVPPDGLLMPRGKNQAEEGEEHAHYAEHRLPRAVSLSIVRQQGVAHAIDGVEIEPDEHPDDEANPCIGREEEHHAHAAHDACHGNPGDERRAEASRSVGHGTADHQNARADEGEGEE